MSPLRADSDRDWERFGREDPYYGVVVDPRFRRDRLTPEAVEEFFATGERHVVRVFEVIHERLDPTFAPERALEFGCGVGRVLVALAARARRVVGADVSPSMIAEAERNCAARGVANVELVCGEAGLSGSFDLVHAYIVLQHVERGRGHRLVERLADLVAENGIAVLHVLHSNDLSSRARLVRWLRARSGLFHRLWNRREGKPADRPLMQMNPSDVNRVLDVLQRRGFHDCHLRFTDHFGHRGALVFARRRTLESF